MPQTHASDAPHSYYAASAPAAPEHAPAKGDISADVCVIGGGLTGLSTALNLAENGYRVVLLESRQIAFGASGRSGGQLIFGYGCEQDKIEQLIGADDARKLWQASLSGIDILRERVRRHSISCDLQRGHAHVALKPRQAGELQSWQEQLEQTYGYSSLEYWDKVRVREEVRSARYIAGMYDANSGHLHPLKYTLGLARAASEAGVQLHENSHVTEVTPAAQSVRVRTNTATVTARYAVLAGNAYLSGVVESIESRVMPVGTYIAATEPLGETRCRDLIPRNTAVADINFVLDYYRCSADWRLLFGGRVSYSTRAPRNLSATMGKRMQWVFPQLKGTGIDYAWGGFVGITVNRAPHFGRVGSNILFAQGFSGHGIAATGLAGKLMADTIRGQAETFDVFCRIPHQPFPGGRALRTPALVLAMSWFRMMDLLP